jgi:hypothetical protein
MRTVTPRKSQIAADFAVGSEVDDLASSQALHGPPRKIPAICDFFAGLSGS